MKQAARPRQTSSIPTPDRSARLLREVAYDRLRAAILGGAVPADRYFSSRDLSVQFGIGMTPLRSAVDRLAAEGLLLVSPQRGIAVSLVSAAEICALFEAREAIECFIVRSVAARLTAAQGAALMANLSTQRAAVKKKDIPELVRTDAEFHQLLTEFHGNSELIRVMGQWRDRIRQIITRVAVISPQRLIVSGREHVAIGTAIRAGRAREASDLMAEHLRRGQAILAPL